MILAIVHSASMNGVLRPDESANHPTMHSIISLYKLLTMVGKYMCPMSELIQLYMKSHIKSI